MILATDTTGSTLVACLADAEGKLLWSASRPGRGQQLLAIVSEGLVELDSGWDRLSGIACCTGPGSFTGTRVGLATCTGLARAHRHAGTAIPLVGLSSLTVRAWGHEPGPEPYVVACPAGRGESFIGQYLRTGPGRPRPVSDIKTSPLERHPPIDGIDCSWLVSEAVAALAAADPAAPWPQPSYGRAPDAQPPAQAKGRS